MSGNYTWTVGIDPDSVKYGVAVYHDDKLVELWNMETPELVNYLEHYKSNILQVVIEDVLANKFVYGRNSKGGSAVVATIARKVGMCGQAQRVAMQFCEQAAIPVELVKPTKDNWAKDRKRFERITGWTGQSNEDTRSAAYFGRLFV